MKLAKPIKHSNAYRIQLMIDSEKLSCPYDTVKECEQWAA